MKTGIQFNYRIKNSIFLPDLFENVPQLPVPWCFEAYVIIFSSSSSFQTPFCMPEQEVFTILYSDLWSIIKRDKKGTKRLKFYKNYDKFKSPLINTICERSRECKRGNGTKARKAWGLWEIELYLHDYMHLLFIFSESKELKWELKNLYCNLHFCVF